MEKCQALPMQCKKFYFEKTSIFEKNFVILAHFTHPIPMGFLFGPAVWQAIADTYIRK